MQRVHQAIWLCRNLAHAAAIRGLRARCLRRVLRPRVAEVRKSWRQRPRVSRLQTDEVPEDVRAFLYDHIESYEQLEILLLLQRERSETRTAERLSSRLKVSLSLAAPARLASIGTFIAPRLAFRHPAGAPTAVPGARLWWPESGC